MCHACRLNLDADGIKKQLRALIAEHGWAVVGVEHDFVPFAYTVGLTEKGLPELLLEGIGPMTGGQAILNELAERQIKAGAFEDGQVTQAEGRQLRIEPLHTLIKLKGVTGLYKRHQPAPTARKIVIVPTKG